MILNSKQFRALKSSRPCFGTRVFIVWSFQLFNYSIDQSLECLRTSMKHGPCIRARAPSVLGCSVILDKVSWAKCVVCGPPMCVSLHLCVVKVLNRTNARYNLKSVPLIVSLFLQDFSNFQVAVIAVYFASVLLMNLCKQH